MSSGLYDLLASGGERDNRFFGVVTGTVTNNKDEEGLGRVKVRFVAPGDESAWARVAAPMAGPARGAYFLPEVGDEVLVAFEHGDARFPYVLGALWNTNAKPPETNEDGANNRRLIKSRSGHVIRLDDTEGAAKIEITDASGNNRIVIDAAAKSVSIAAEGAISIEAKGALTLKGATVEIN